MNWKEYNDTNLNEEVRFLRARHKMLDKLDKIIISLLGMVIITYGVTR